LPRKKKRPVFKVSTAVKAAAREQIGSPRPARVVPDRKQRQKREKHKPTLGKLLKEQ
jgi:hypothetical protein